MFIIFLYDLIRTNPDWRCFQQNYCGVVFCAEIKVLGMSWKLQRIFLENIKNIGAKRYQRGVPRWPQGWEAHPLPCRRLVGPLDLSPMPKTPINTETPEKKPRSGVPPPQASVATKNQSGARSGILPEGETITGGHLHHPGGLHDEEGVVLPRGWGYVPVAMCLISLSLSRVLDLSRSWCTASFVIIVGSYGVSSPLPSCDELSFTFEVSLLSDWILLWIWEHLMYVLRGIPVVTMGCSIDSLDVCFGTQLTDSRGDIGVIYA